MGRTLTGAIVLGLAAAAACQRVCVRHSDCGTLLVCVDGGCTDPPDDEPGTSEGPEPDVGAGDETGWGETGWDETGSGPSDETEADTGTGADDGTGTGSESDAGGTGDDTDDGGLSGAEDWRAP